MRAHSRKANTDRQQAQRFQQYQWCFCTVGTKTLESVSINLSHVETHLAQRNKLRGCGLSLQASPMRIERAGVRISPTSLTAVREIYSHVFLCRCNLSSMKVMGDDCLADG